MKLFTLLLVTAQAAGTVGCEIGRNLQYERTDGSSHNLDCLSSNAAHDSVVAICLLQVNKLSHVIQCTDSEEELTLSSSVEPGSPVDGVDLVPLPDGQHPDKNDGMLYYTPRGLLVSAAEPCFASNACKANLPDLFRLCPYDDIPKFVQCLCCHLVDDKDIQSLQSFINQYVLARDQQLVSDHGKIIWECPSYCGVPASVSRRDSLVERHGIHHGIQQLHRRQAQQHPHRVEKVYELKHWKLELLSEQKRDTSSGYAQPHPDNGYAQPHPDNGYAQPHPDSGYAQPHPDNGYAQPHPDISYAQPPVSHTDKKEHRSGKTFTMNREPLSLERTASSYGPLPTSVIHYTHVMYEEEPQGTSTIQSVSQSISLGGVEPKKSEEVDENTGNLFAINTRLLYTLVILILIV